LLKRGTKDLWHPLLLDARLTLPKDVLIDPRFRGTSAERIYNMIESRELCGPSGQDREKPSPESGSGDQSWQPNQGEGGGGTDFAPYFR
jgi:hypothetical protein